MDYVIPIYYTEAGRGITRFHAIPYQVDCLKPVHRRILLGAYEIARKKFTKSAKVVGHVIGNYHFHGDKAVYDSMVNLVQQGFIIGQGNWGSPGVLEDNPPAAYRYTECKLADWVDELAFKYIKFVPWQAWETHTVEPLFLPSPVPVGLIGNGLLEGIAFHTTLIPKFKLRDLLNRLDYLLQNKNGKVNFNPEEGCEIIECDKEDILQKGSGKIKVRPKIEVNEDQRYVDILGRPYKKTYKPLLKYIEDNKLPITVKDLCDKNFRMRLITTAKFINSNFERDFNKFVQFFQKKFLEKTHHVKIIVCDEQGAVHQKGIDDLILLSYNNWKTALFNKMKNDYNSLSERLFENYIVSLIKTIIVNNSELASVDKLIDIFRNKYKQVAVCEIKGIDGKVQQVQITENDIVNVCNKIPIKKLIEYKINIDKLQQEQETLLKTINNIDNTAYDEAMTFKSLKL